MSGFSDVGNLMHLYLDEIEPREGTDASEFLIKAAANLVNQHGGRNWIPVIVKETGKKRYQVIGNSFIYAVAEEAGLERVWCIIADASEGAAEVSRVLAGEEIPKVNLSTASRDEIMAALQYLIERPGSDLKGVKLAVATNRIEEAPRETWQTLNPIANLKCGITKGKKLNALKEVFYLTPTAAAQPESKPAKSGDRKTKTQPTVPVDGAQDGAALSNLSVSALKQMAKQRGLSGYSKLKKDELLQLLNAS